MTITKLDKSDLATAVPWLPASQEHWAGIETEWTSPSEHYHEVISEAGDLMPIGSRFVLRRFIMPLSVYGDSIDRIYSDDPVALVLAHSRWRRSLLEAIWPIMQQRYPDHWSQDGDLLTTIQAHG